MVKNKDNLSFYDLKSKKKFKPDSYTVVKKNNRRFAKAKNPKTGNMCWRILSSKPKKKTAKKKSSKK